MDALVSKLSRMLSVGLFWRHFSLFSTVAHSAGQIFSVRWVVSPIRPPSPHACMRISVKNHSISKVVNVHSVLGAFCDSKFRFHAQYNLKDGMRGTYGLSRSWEKMECNFVTLIIERFSNTHLNVS